jgi:hypothetical protein
MSELKPETKPETKPEMQPVAEPLKAVTDAVTTTLKRAYTMSDSIKKNNWQRPGLGRLSYEQP